uniref:Uncharacterized protein n=1 Tax=Panagrolaimus sp. PS1159 TaxID=55785 RepID=A0AC35FQ13_9BILA
MSKSPRPSNQPLNRHDGNVDVELCHIVAFATKADLTVKKVDDKKVNVHFEKPGCFCGAMTLTMSIKLICILELAIVSILILQAPDLLHRTTNNHFYVTDGSFVFFSVPLFLLEMFILLTCLISILMLFYAIIKCKAAYVLPHLAWQVFYAFISTIICTSILIFASFGKIMWPSAIVLGIFDSFKITENKNCFLVILIGVPGVLEVWWLFTVVDFYRQVLINERLNIRLRRDSQEALRNIFANGLLNFHKNKFRKGSSIA